MLLPMHVSDADDYTVISACQYCALLYKDQIKQEEIIIPTDGLVKFNLIYIVPQ